MTYPAFQVGVHVTSTGANGVTRHVIVARCVCGPYRDAPSGVVLRVDPRVPGTASTNAWVCASRFQLEQR